MKPFVAVLDYGIGNLRSAQKALLLSGAEAELTDDPKVISQADGVVLPGVGHFGKCMKAVEKLKPVIAKVIEAQKPFLGICVGMQMLYKSSKEAPDVSGLNILEGEISLLDTKSDDTKKEMSSRALKLPQIQWNQITVRASHYLLEGLDKSWMYFVHSYVPPIDENCIAVSSYGKEFCAVVAKGSVVATQFHPEKSGEDGLKLIGNFVKNL